MTDHPIPHLETSQFGAVDFEGQHVPCAFAGKPGNFTAYVLIDGVCQIIGIPLDVEIGRIKSNHLLSDGLVMIRFPKVDVEGNTTWVDRPTISLMRLHTWLALIPPDSVSSDEMRRKLEATQRHFTDVVYAYFGRHLLPPEIREEDNPYIDPERKKLYDALETAGQLDNRLTNVEKKLEELSVAVSAGSGGENISADQQEQLKAMIDMICNRYEEKHGKGTRGPLIQAIKEQHNFRFFNTVSRQSWPGLVKDLVFRYQQLTPRGATLPRVFQIALESVQQSSLF